MNDSIRLISIDPGLTNFGFAIFELHSNGEYTLLEADTFCTEHHLNDYNYIVELHGERQAKLFLIRSFFTEILEKYRPLGVGSEIPYFNRKRPMAFEALVAVVTTIEACVIDYDPGITFYRIPAASVKKNMEVSGRSGDKNLMKTAVLGKGIKYYGAIDSFGPDTIDAIAVGVSLCNELNNYC
jgi:Holliday junction resolvasome RuvABC endonuclease subunit